ncbi:MAG TPA: hypothetical protein VHE61_13220 [Opitutaceae bacterium]|nr:hypothetical protein [Opitutaceae bacterium]
MRRWVLAVALLLASVVTLSAQPAPQPFDLRSFAPQAAGIFNAGALTNPDADLNRACDRLLLVCQAASALLVVSGMIIRLRHDAQSMEGVASTMLKVAFIATVPFWSTFLLETSDAVANAVGDRAITEPGSVSPTITRLWNVAWQWTPDSTPYLDALEAQRADNIPESGGEMDWSMQAWNWARGLGDTTGTPLHTLWQAVSGGLRAGLVLIGCALLATLVLFAIIATYAAEVLRYFVYASGCTLLPLFIGGLSVPVLRAYSVRFIVAVFSTACWPVGWALANTVSVYVLGGLDDFMGRTVHAALLSDATASVPPVAMAAPYLAWGVLFLLGAFTLAACAWYFASLVAVPLLIGKMVSSGVHTANRWTGGSPVNVTPIIVPAAAAPSHPVSVQAREYRSGPAATPSAPMAVPWLRTLATPPAASAVERKL